MKQFVAGELDFAGLQRNLSEALAAGATREEALDALRTLAGDERVSPPVVALLRRAVDRHFSSDDTDPFPKIRPSRDRDTERVADDGVDATVDPGDEPGLPAMFAEGPGEEEPAPEELPPESPVREAEPGVGDVIAGRYELEGLIGRGGTGLVYRAVDRCRIAAGLAEPRVALKLLKPDLTGRKEARQRLLAEGLRGGEVWHENLVRVFDVGEDGGDCFVVMELLDGDNLRTVILRHSPDGLPVEEGMRVLEGIARGLESLHSRGLVHGDLKPGNVFLTRDGCPKLLDCGIATRHGHDREPLLDGAGPPGRTPAYASPEVLGGTWPQPSDDVFALGCVACELLSSKHPFGRVQADDAREQRLTPVLPKTLSGGRRRVLARALRFDGTKRPADAAAFLAAIGTGERRGGRARFTAGVLTGLGLGIFLVLLIIHPSGPLARVLGFGGLVATTPAISPPAGEAEAAGPSPGEPAQEIRSPSVDVAGRFVPTEPVTPAEAATETSEQTSPTVSAEPPPPTADAVPTPAEPAPPLPSGPGRLAFATGEIRVIEGTAVVIATVDRQGGNTGDVTFRWRTVADSATGDVDYAASDWEEATVPDGSASVRLYVPLVDDGLTEQEESFFLELAEPGGGASLGSPARLRVRIADDER